MQAVVELATAEFELTPPSPISSSPFRLSAEGQSTFSLSLVPPCSALFLRICFCLSLISATARELQERLQQYLLTVGRFIVRAFLLAAAGPVSFLFLHQIIDILAMMMRFQHTQVTHLCLGLIPSEIQSTIHEGLCLTRCRFALGLRRSCRSRSRVAARNRCKKTRRGPS